MPGNKHPQNHKRQTRPKSPPSPDRSPQTESRPDLAPTTLDLASWPAAASARPLRAAHVLRRQQILGNRVTRRQLVQNAPRAAPRERRRPSVLSRLVEYNDEVVGGRFVDPEQARGVLPFTEDGWDGREIGQRLSQLDDAVARHDNVRCVQASFLVALVQRGPGALRGMIQNYLNRYRTGIRQATTPPRIKRWYRRSIRNLSPLLGKIDDQTLTYGDLSTVLTEMYEVYGVGGGGTGLRAEMTMVRREGYTAQAMNMSDVTQEEAAAEAQKLTAGEFLSCGVNVSREGTGAVDHAVHIGRYPDSETLYLYDPWPVQGNQLIDTDENLTEITHYFENPLEAEGEEEEDGIEIAELRSFRIDAKFSPPAEEAE